MNRQPSPQHIIAILSALEQRSDGATVADLTGILTPPVSEDQLRAWLDALEAQHWVAGEGANRYKRFSLAAGAAADLATLRAEQAKLRPPQRADSAPPPQASAPSIAPASAEASAVPPIPDPAVPSGTAAVTPAAPTGAATFESMYPLAVLDIVGGGMDRETALFGLRKQAFKNGHEVASAAAYVRYAIDRLDTLSRADAETFGVSPAQFEAWRSRWLGSDRNGDQGPATRDEGLDGQGPAESQGPRGFARESEESARSPHSQVEPQPAAPTDVNPARRPPTEHKRPEVAVTRLLRPLDTPAPPRATTAQSAVRPPPFSDRLQIAWRDLKVASGMPPDAPALTFGRAVGVLRKLWSGRITFHGHTLTLARAVIASLWAAGWLAFFERHMAINAAFGGMLSYVIAALPWLAFRLFDGGFTWAAGGQAVLVGGTVSYALALPSRPVVAWLFGTAPRTLAAVAALFTATPATRNTAATEAPAHAGGVVRNSEEAARARAADEVRLGQKPATERERLEVDATGASRPQNTPAEPPSAAAGAVDRSTPPSPVAPPPPSTAPTGVVFNPPPAPKPAPEPPPAAEVDREPVDPAMAIPATADPDSEDRNGGRVADAEAETPIAGAGQRPGTTDATGASHPQDKPAPPAATTPPSTVQPPPPLPAFPAAPGAYALIAGAWTALPRNNGGIVKNFVQSANGFFGKLNQFEDKLAGKTPGTSTDVVGNLVFSGREEAPPAPAAAVVIAYVGPLALSAKFVANYPTVQMDSVYAPMELAPLKPMNNGNRYTPMSAVFADLTDFGPRRLPASVETAGPNVTVLRCTAPLPAGRYALACGKQYFELQVN